MINLRLFLNFSAGRAYQHWPKTRERFEPQLNQLYTLREIAKCKFSQKKSEWSASYKIPHQGLASFSADFKSKHYETGIQSAERFRE